MKRLLLYIYFCGLFLALWSCGPESRETEETVLDHASDSLAAVQEEPVRKTDIPEGDTLSFEIAGQQFFQAVKMNDTLAVNEFIHPELGLWVAEQPGAMPRFTHVQHIQNFKREYQRRSFFTINQELKTCELQQAAFPKFDCAWMDQGRTGYASDGCFFWHADKFKNSNMWDYASLSDAELNQVKQSLPLLRHTILHTNSNFKFHFGYDDGKWYLLFAELIYPCSA